MNLALFDFDGTITRRELFGDFMRRAVPPRRLALGQALLAPVVAGYKLGVVSGSAARSAVVAVGLRRVAEQRVRQVGEDFAREVIPGTLRPTAMERIRWHQERGDTVVVVSGAFDVYLAPWCRQHGLGLLCSALEARDGVLTGRYRGAQCVNGEKARRVQVEYPLADYAQVYAYGDTREDRALLAIAHHRYFRWQPVR